MKSPKAITTEDILIKLCKSIAGVLSEATNSPVRYSAMVQKINKTSLKPDIGCFVLFDGGFTGLVVTNFSQYAALELYRKYMLKMGISEEDLAINHTSDDVADVLGELMNQTVGDFTGKIRHELDITITQNQPKMLAFNKQILLSVDTNLDRPQARRVSFTTEDNNIFYLELAMDKAEFIQLEEFEMQEQEELDPDAIIKNEEKRQQEKASQQSMPVEDDTNDLLSELGL